MHIEPMHGVYPILETPFQEDGATDEETLRRLKDFNIAAGVHGLGVALAKDIIKLNCRTEACHPYHRRLGQRARRRRDERR